jgi:peptide/nickel transport system substrate-binding protein
VIEDNAVTFTDEPPWTKGRTVRKEIVDDYTVKFTSDVPYPFLINYMSASQFSVWSRFLPMHFLKQYHAEIVGEEAANAKAKAAGMNTWDQLYMAFGSTNHQSSMQVQRSYPPTLAPYVLVDRDENLITYERNPFYWAIDTAGNQLPYIDRIVFEQVNNREILDGKVISGEADWAGFDLKTESLPLYREYEESGNYTTSVWNCTFNTVIMRYNFNHQDPYLAELFLEKDFRMALQITVNRSRINDEVMFGLAKEYRMGRLARSPRRRRAVAGGSGRRLRDPEDPGDGDHHQRLAGDRAQHHLRGDGLADSLAAGHRQQLRHVYAPWCVQRAGHLWRQHVQPARPRERADVRHLVQDRGTRRHRAAAGHNGTV